MSRPRVLSFIFYYLPGFKSGGPVRTLANMVAHLGDDLDFHIVTGDRDWQDPEPYAGMTIDGWNDVGKARVYYVSPSAWSLKRVARIIRETPHDILYLNSFFNPRFTGLPLWARLLGRIPKRPVVLAPRGEFSPGALQLKALKKRVYLGVTRLLGLYRNLTFQASSEREAGHIRDRLGRKLASRIVVAPDLPPPFEAEETDAVTLPSQPGEPLRIAFVSRITRMKNLGFALAALSRVQAPVQFDIYGIIDDPAYWAECQELLKKLPSHIRAEYHGVADHADVRNIFATHDLFFLPTRGENFGHVILESLSAGTPPLIADTTPWQDLDAHGVGYVRSLDDMSAFIAAIDAFAAQPADARIRQRQAAKACAHRVATDADAIDANRRLFTDLLDR